MFTSIFFAWIALMLATRNWVISVYAAFSIFLVISTIMASMNMFGWALGIAESIGLIVFVGFAVDYIVHMCHQYVESVFFNRKERMDSCFNQIGSTIFNGAFTSLVAGIFLYMCQYSYLHKFGIMMMITISTALVFSMTFYPALCYFKGP